MDEAQDQSQIYLLQSDLLTLDVDVIVCSANNDLILGAGISGALRRMAPEVQDECTKIGTIPLGEVAMTPGGSLRARHVLHAAVNPLGFWADAKSVRSTTRHALERAAKEKFKSIAFSPIGCDAGGFSAERCALILADEFTQFLRKKSSIEQIFLVLYDEKTHEIFEEKMKPKIPDLRLDSPSTFARADEEAEDLQREPNQEPTESA